MPWPPGWTTLPFLHGGTNGAAYGISADGNTVVGFANDGGDDSDSPRQACYWTPTSGPIPIGPSNSQAFVASSNGSIIIGGAALLFRWTASGGAVSFGVSSDGANACTPDASIVVGSTFSASPKEQACYWNSSGVMTLLGFLPGRDQSRAMGVSADGSVIVGYSMTTPDSTGASQHAFRWTASTGMVDLGVLPGTTSSRAFGVSNDGTIVVGGTGGSPSAGAFRWTASTGMVAVPSMVIATGISGDGSTIMGSSFYAPDPADFDNTYLGYNTSAGTTVPLPLTTMAAGTYPDGVSADGLVFVGFSYGSDTLPWVYAIGAGETLTDAELIFEPWHTFADFTNVAMRRLFVAAGGTPAWVGPYGSIPFNGVPAVYLTTEGPPLDFAQNNGGGGSFVPTGTISAATSTPGCTPYYVTEASGPAGDPKWRLSVSDDGGRTWGTLVKPRSIGQLGHYLQRLRWLKMGQSRERMVKLECTDPVRRNIVGIYIDASQGMS